MRVETYYNLHKQCLSYRERGGKVSHAQAMILDNVTFAVQPAGRERVRREGKKNVHAFIRGDLSWTNDNYYASIGPVLGLDDYTAANMERQGYRKITYNPYRYDSFVMVESGEPIHKATQVVIIGKNIYLSGRKND